MCNLNPLYKDKDKHLPPILNHERLTKLGIDEDIWQDFIVNDFEANTLPPWLIDGKVCKGICYAQELKNCEWELERLKAKHANHHEWLTTEFQSYWALFDSCMSSGALNVAFFPSVPP